MTGSGTYQYLDIATLAAKIDDGYRFVKWSDDNEYNPRVFVVREDLTVEAICEEAPVIDDVEADRQNAVRGHQGHGPHLNQAMGFYAQALA